MADEALQKFRDVLNEFKRPYIESLEEYQPIGPPDEDAPLTTEELQQNDRIQDVLGRLDMLYTIIEAIIKADGNAPVAGADLDARAVWSALDKRAGLGALRATPALKEEFLDALHTDIKLYPFTLNKKLIDTFEKQKVETYQREIVPNV